MQKRILQAAMLVLLVIGIVLGEGGTPAYALTEGQKLVNEAWRIVNRTYVDETFNHQNWSALRQKAMSQPLDNSEVTYQAIQKMLANLNDPFTRLLKPDQYRSLQTSTSGELTGVGLQIALDAATGELRVIAPIADSPADQAGLLPYDQIVEINEVSTKGMSLDDAAAQMRGPIGSSVKLTVKREGKSQITVQLVRDRISLNPVYAELKELRRKDVSANANGAGQTRIGYLRLSQFNANATIALTTAIQHLEQQGAEAYILDLRNNPGGLLQSGIEIARLWLNEGTVVYTVDRQGVQDSFESSGQALTSDPLVVLVNQGTASASEILAGALQDNGRALLVGEKTFGKGLIQSLFELSDGSGLAVTVAKYETPNHHDINQQGIEPNRTVPLEPITRDQIGTVDDRQYQAAVELLTTPTVLVGAS